MNVSLNQGGIVQKASWGRDPELVERERKAQQDARERVAADRTCLHEGPIHPAGEEPDDWRTRERRRQTDAADRLLRY